MPNEANSNEICARAGCFHQLGSHNIFYEGGGCQECPCDAFLPTRETLPQVAEGVAAKKAVLAAHPDKEAMRFSHDIWVIGTPWARLDSIIGSGASELLAWENAASKLPPADAPKTLKADTMERLGQEIADMPDEEFAPKAQHIPIGGDPNAVCADCRHHEMNHANYQGVPRACNQTRCPCRCYVPPAPKGEDVVAVSITRGSNVSDVTISGAMASGTVEPTGEDYCEGDTPGSVFSDEWAKPKADPERVPDETLRQYEQWVSATSPNAIASMAHELLRRREQDSAQGQGFEEWWETEWSSTEHDDLPARSAWHARDAEVAGLRERLKYLQADNRDHDHSRQLAVEGRMAAESALKEMREKTIRKCADVAFAYEQDGDDMKRPYCLRDSILALLAPAAEPHQPHEEGQGVR